MIDFSLCIETTFTEDGQGFPDRIRAAAASGFSAVEIWEWWNKPIAEMRTALHETDTSLLTLCAEHWQDKCRLGEPASRALFVERVQRAADTAVALGTPNVVVLSGDRLPDLDPAAQHDALLEALASAADAISGANLTLLLEVVNRQLEGPNALVADSATAIDLLRRLDRPNVRFLYDRYHAILNGEPLGWAIAGNIDLVGHIQAADVPGRHELGTGEVDWAAELNWLRANGYSGHVGIEIIPTGTSSAIHANMMRLISANG